MDIYTLIRRDHDNARDLMDKIIGTEDSRTRLKLFEQLKVAILAHAKAEEKTFYDAMNHSGDKELAEETPHFRKEHKEAEKLFAEVEACNPCDSHWWEKFGELKKTLTHHMEEEEKEIFPTAKKDIPADEAEELGEAMEQLEAKAKRRLSNKAA